MKALRRGVAVIFSEARKGSMHSSIGSAMSAPIARSAWRRSMRQDWER
jgi:hypothetical protein